MFKAVIFDLDGTILDTIEDIAESMNRVLKKHGYETHYVEEYKYFAGDGMRTLAYRSLPEDKRDEANVNRFYELMREEYGKSLDVKTHPFPGIEETLKELCGLGVKINVLSNKPHDFTVEVVKKYFGGIKFDVIMGESKSCPKKPDPSGAIGIAEKLNIAAVEFVYVGDTDTDMKTAVNAGMYPLGVSWGFRPPRELVENGAAIVISKPSAILELFRP